MSIALLIQNPLPQELHGGLVAWVTQYLTHPCTVSSVITVSKLADGPRFAHCHHSHHAEFPTWRHFCSVAFLPPTEWAAPHSVSREFKDSSSSHSGPNAHGHHPICPVEGTPCWLGEGRKGRSPTKLSPDQAELGRPRRSWAQRMEAVGMEFPNCPPRHTHGRCLLQARVPFTGLSWKTGSQPCILISECVQVYFPRLPSGAQLGDPPGHPHGESASPLPTALQLVEQRNDLSSPSAAQWVAQGHGTPQRVHLLGGQS